MAVNGTTIRERLTAKINSLPEPTPITPARKHEEMLQDMQEPSTITVCHTCGNVSFMWRMGCPSSDCPSYPFSVNVSHQFFNYQGQYLLPMQDFVLLQWRDELVNR